jgi:undecaprenyl pyrophosphate phosphatase UppP
MFKTFRRRLAKFLGSFIAVWNRVLANAWVGTLVTLLMLIAGLFGSLYTHEARETVKGWIPRPEAYATALVVGGIIIGVALFFFRQRALDSLKWSSAQRPRGIRLVSPFSDGSNTAL